MRRAIAIGALLVLAACGGGSGGGQTPPATLEEPEASEAVAAAALSVGAALVELGGDPTGAEGIVAGGQCVRGMLTGTCVARSSGATLRLTARGCELDDPARGQHLTVDGQLTMTTPFPACDLQLPADGVRTYRFADFGVVVEDDAGVAARFAAERLQETVQPLATGCDGHDAAIDLDGGLTVARRAGLDATLRASDLHLERRSVGASGTCTHTITAQGGLRIDDRGADRVDDVELEGLTVETDATGGVRRLDGGLALDCAPAVTLVTDDALVPGGGCPSAGSLAFARANGSRSVAVFSRGGVAIDTNSDGTPEQVTADCAPANLARCP